MSSRISAPAAFLARIDRIGVGDDHVDGLRLGAADLVRLLKAVELATLDRSEHDHAVAKGQLRMRDLTVFARLDELRSVFALIVILP